LLLFINDFKQKFGIEEPLDLTAYTSIIEGYLKDKNVDFALKIKQAMFSKGIKPDIRLYTMMVTKFIRIPNIQEKQYRELIIEMTDQGVEATSSFRKLLKNCPYPNVDQFFSD